MKSLLEFVENYDKKPKYNYPTDILRSFDSFCENNNNRIDEDWYVNNVCDNRYNHIHIGHTNNIVSVNDYITEMLKSVTCKQLIKLLNRDFAEKYGQIFSSKPRLDDRKTHTLIIPYEIFKNDWETFQSKLNAYMWYETRHFNIYGVANNEPIDFKIDKVDGKEYISIIVDPIQAKDCTDYVYNNCKGIIYHVPNQDKIDNIMKSGLRMKGSKNTYKFIVDRVYFICGENDDEIKRRLKKIIADKYVNDNPIIFKIDLIKHDYQIIFYEDPAYKNRDAIYTYAYFPSKYIEKMNFSDI